MTCSCLQSSSTIMPQCGSLRWQFTISCTHKIQQPVQIASISHKNTLGVFLKWTQAPECNIGVYKNTRYASADTMYEISKY